MMRTYKTRSQQIEVDQLDDLLLVKTGSADIDARLTRGECLIAWQGQLLGVEPIDRLPDDARQLLAGSSWLVVAEVRGRQSVPSVHPLSVGRLYRDQHGAWMINTGGITVRLKEGLTKSAVDQALSRYGLSVKRELKFAPNLYEAEAATPDQALDAAQAASHDEQFVYAEPNMLRELGHR